MELKTLNYCLFLCIPAYDFGYLDAVSSNILDALNTLKQV